MTKQSHVTAGLALAALGLACSGSALAEETGWYFGFSGGISSTGLSKGDVDRRLVNDIAAGLAEEDLILTQAAVASDLDDSDKAWGINIGYRINRFVAAEVGYLDLGKFVYENAMNLTVDDGPGGLAAQVFPSTSDFRLTVRGPFASVMGMFALGERFDVHVRGGLLFADTRARTRMVLDDIPDSLTSFETKDSSSDFFGGIGATWNINPSYSLRLEYQKFLDVGDDHTGESDVDVVNVSILFR